MKTKAICIVCLVSFVLIIGPASLTAQSESEAQLIKFYESCIQKKISNCDAKTVLKTSRSGNLQRKADLSIRQIQFVTTNKDMLINEMLDQGIGYKEYKVEYYLNKRFFETRQ
jgi:hypothetical protein